MYPGLEMGQLLAFTPCHGPGTTVRVRVNAGAVDNEDCSSFDQGARRNMSEKQPCANATSFMHKPMFISISLLCNHVIYYR